MITATITKDDSIQNDDDTTIAALSTSISTVPLWILTTGIVVLLTTLVQASALQGYPLHQLGNTILFLFLQLMEGKGVICNRAIDTFALFLFLLF
jgi:hypothetical protein